jgi:thymidylate kinase
MKKAVFFSGTHGCGKTTTIEKVSASFGFELFSSSDGDHGNPYGNPFHRQVWRLNKYYLDALNVLEQQDELAKGLLLVDRCVFDHEAYTRAFYSMGWLTHNQYSKIEGLRKVYFDSPPPVLEKDILPQNIVFFLPPEEWTVNRIKQRWNEEKKKWNEGDFDYLHVLREQYEGIYLVREARRNVLVVTETNLESRVNQINEFLSGLV